MQVEIAGTAPLVAADAAMLRIVLLNLVLNAAHAVQHHGRISISIGATPDGCRIRVGDTGPGPGAAR